MVLSHKMGRLISFIPCPWDRDSLQLTVSDTLSSTQIDGAEIGQYSGSSRVVFVQNTLILTLFSLKLVSFVSTCKQNIHEPLLLL